MVVFSAVRSSGGGELGFLADPRRANVALTRARSGVIVVGDPGTLGKRGPNSKAAGGSVWGDWLAWVGRGWGEEAAASANAAVASAGLAGEEAPAGGPAGGAIGGVQPAAIRGRRDRRQPRRKG